MVVSEVLSGYPYLLMLMKLYHVDWDNNMEIMNIRVDEGGIVKVQAWKFQRFSRNEFWRKIGCLVFAPTVFWGGSRLW